MKWMVLDVNQAKDNVMALTRLRKARSASTKNEMKKKILH